MRHPLFRLALIGLALAGVSSPPARGQDTVTAPDRPEVRVKGWPRSLVDWVADPDRPLFSGGGENAWDRNIRERGWIVAEDGLFHLLYTGYNADRSPREMLGHATSPDGLRWTRDPRNPIHDSSWVEDMCVVEHDGGYIMFAEGERDIAHRLTSPDLIHWTDRGPLDIRRADGEPITPGPRGTPFVLIVDGVWNLFYERGDRGVWRATSTDGVVWTNVQDEPVLPMGPEAYDRHAVAVNQVIENDDGYYYAVYHANAHRPWKEWTTCLARSRDLTRWEKYPGNPIVADNRSSGIFVTGSDGVRHLYTMHPDVRRFSNPRGHDAASGAAR